MEFNRITWPGGPVARLALRIYKQKSGLIYMQKKGNTPRWRSLDTLKVKNRCENEIISSLFKPLASFPAISVFLHGSWADATNNRFSDIDDFVVLNDEVISHREMPSVVRMLNRVDMNFCKIDPLQHHGHWITSASELRDYDNSFIPLFTLREGLHVSGSDRIEFKINSEKTVSGLKENIYLTCDTIHKLTDKALTSSLNLYGLKCLVGSFALMPALIFQLSGKQISKKRAIGECGRIFSNKAAEMIRWSSEYRNNWSDLTAKPNYKFFSQFTSLFSNPHFWRHFASRFAPKIPNEDTHQLTLRLENIRCFINESKKFI